MQKKKVADLAIRGAKVYTISPSTTLLCRSLVHHGLVLHQARNVGFPPSYAHMDLTFTHLVAIAQWAQNLETTLYPTVESTLLIQHQVILNSQVK